MQSAENRLAAAPMGKLLLSMGIPTVIAQLVNLLYSIVDRIYIGHIPEIGTDALTGIGVTVPIITIISAFSSFVGGGGAPLAAISLGQKDIKKAEKILGNGVIMLLFFSALLTGLTYLLKDIVLYKIGASAATFVYADDYLSVYAIGTVFVQLTIGLNTFLTAQGKSKFAMISVLIGAVTNIALDPLFIYTFNMGVKGAALATIISQMLSALWILAMLVNRKTYLKLKLSAMKPDIKIIGKISALGISPFVMQSTESLITIVMNKGLQTYGGDLYVGSLTVLSSVMQIIAIPAHGFTEGTQPIISYNFGAGNKSRVREAFLKILAVVMCYEVPVTLFAMICPATLSGIFTDDPELISLMVKVMPIFLCGMLVFGLQRACQSAFLGMGQAKISLFIALLRKVFLLVPLAIILPKLTGSVMGVYIAEPISDTISALTCTVLFFLNFNKINERKI